MSVKALFDFVTDATVTESNMNEYLDRVSERMIDQSSQDQVEDQVFKEAYIPQRLEQVIDFERDIKLAKAGQKDLIYKTLIGLKADLSEPALVPEILDSNPKGGGDLDEDDADSSSEGDSEKDDEDEYKKSKFISSARPRNETADERKERKKAVKEQQAEKRKVKMKKKDKRRLVKSSNRKKK